MIHLVYIIIPAAILIDFNHHNGYYTITPTLAPTPQYRFIAVWITNGLAAVASNTLYESIANVCNFITNCLFYHILSWVHLKWPARIAVDIVRTFFFSHCLFNFFNRHDNRTVSVIRKHFTPLLYYYDSVRARRLVIRDIIINCCVRIKFNNAPI